MLNDANDRNDQTADGQSNSNGDEPVLGFADTMRKVVVQGVRFALPFIDDYARSQPPGHEFKRGDDFKLSSEENKVLTEAATKLFYESATVLKAWDQQEVKMPTKDTQTGRFPSVNPLHGLAALRLFSSMVSGTTEKKSVSALTDEEQVAAARAVSSAPKPAAAAAKPAAASTVEPTVQTSRAAQPPATPKMMRRAAYQKAAYGYETQQLRAAATHWSQSYNAPQPQPYQRGCCSGRYQAIQSPSYTDSGCMGEQYTPPQPLSVKSESGGCDPAVFAISCDTQYRIKLCIKQAICELLWCLDEKLCPNGQLQLEPGPILKECLLSFLCSLIHCLPEAICPPSADPPEPTVVSLPEIFCNYAVEEKPLRRSRNG